MKTTFSKIIGFTTILNIVFHFTYAQNINITQRDYSNFCVGRTISIQGNTNGGNFNADNNFRVIFRNVYNDSTHFDLPASLENGFFKVELPAQYSIYESSLRMSIYSSSPVKVSNEISVIIKYLPTVKFNGMYQYVSDTFSEYIKTNYISPNKNVFVLLQASGYNSNSGSIKVVFNSGAIMQPNSDYLYFMPKQENYTYKVDSVRNECGYGLIEGDPHPLNVMPIGLEISSITSVNICKGQKIFVSYSSSNKFQNHENWKLELLNKQGAVEKTLDLLYDNQQLSTIIPTDIAPASYYARIITNSPNVYSNLWRKINIFELPDIQVLSPNIEVYPQEKAKFVYYNTGAKPNGYIFNDSLYVGPFGEGGTIGVNKYCLLKPYYQGIYRITNVLSNCGNNRINAEFYVKIKDEIEIFDLPNNAFCVGSKFKIRLKVKSNVNISDLEVRAYDNDNYTIFNHTILGDSIEIQVPQDYYPVWNVKFRVATKDGQYLSNSSASVMIKRLPSANITYGGNYQLSYPEYSGTNVTMTGGGPYYIKHSNDTTTQTLLESPAFISTFIKNSTTLRLLSVRNQCGVGEVGQNFVSFTLNNRPNNVRIAGLNKKIYCVGDPINIQIDTVAQFNSNNEFKLFLTSSYRSDTLLGTSKSTNISGRLTNRMSWYETFNVKVCSTSPAVCSYNESIKLNTYPSGTVSSSYIFENEFNGEGTWVNTNSVAVIKNQYLRLWTSTLGGGTLNYKINNGKQYTIPGETYDSPTSSLSDLIQIKKDTTFSVSEIQNACGTNASPNLPFKAKIVRFKIYTQETSSYHICNNDAWSVNYRLEGDTPSDAIFAVQLQLKDGSYKILETIKDGNPLVVKAPDELKDATAYLYKVICTNYTDYNSFNEMGAWFYRKPKAFISNIGNTDSVFVSRTGNDITLKVQMQSYNTKVVRLLPTKAYFSYGDSVGYTTIFAKPGDVFSLENVYNGYCGYGDVSGKVKVYERPAIAVSNIQFDSKCVGSTISVDFQTMGEFGTNTLVQAIFMDSDYTKYIVAIVNKDAGTMTFNIPNEFRHGYYQLYLTSNNWAVSSYNLGYHYISEKPNVKLVGTTYINPGQTSELAFIIQKGTPPLTVSFEDNSEVNLSYYAGLESFKVPKSMGPTTTTVYKIKSVSNICGTGIGSGQAIIYVNSATGNYINTRDVSLVCAGKNLKIPFQKIGNIPANLAYWAEISDKNSENYTSIPSVLQSDTIIATIPLNIAEGDNYRFRVRVNDNSIQSSSNPTGLTLSFPIRASFVDSVIIKQKNTYAMIPIKITGTLPAFLNGKLNDVFTYHSVYNNLFEYYFSTGNSDRSDSLQIINVSNICGVGTKLYPNKARIVYCKANANLSTLEINNQKDYYEIENEIISQNKINNASKINFDSGKYILLNPGFEVQQGSVFRAIIDGCPGKVNSEN